jgi:hypothetical protein
MTEPEYEPRYVTALIWAVAGACLMWLILMGKELPEKGARLRYQVERWRPFIRGLFGR